MRLKKLILHGFKSFADRTEFAFDCPITGIVGPNGCGKSNVVDGFKWVLGEQSAKSLRGDAMLDVIFNGSATRKPGGMAEVLLVFDNPLGPEGRRQLNLDLDEVSVGRRLFRDGTSEYQVNNQPARLKDVRELFLDTGVGVDAYSVIEQGRVALLLDSNPQERRLIFEEAAGISKFKARKREAQRKLERVDQNLLRVTDIVAEVEKQLRSVRVQAGRARTYQEHSQRLRELRLTYALQEYHTHQQQLGELEKRRDDAQFRLDDAAANLARNQNQLVEQRQEFEALAERRRRTEYELVQTRAAAESAQQRQAYARQQLQHIVEQIEQLHRDRQDIEAKSAEAAGLRGRQEQVLADLTRRLDESRRQIDQRQQALGDAQLQLNTLGREVEAHKSTLLDLMRRLARIANALGAVEIERKNISAQQARIVERRSAMAAESLALDVVRGSLTEKLRVAAGTIADSQAQLDARAAEAAALGQQMARLTQDLAGAREHRSALVSRRRLLEDLEAKREGVSEGVQSVLRQRQGVFNFVGGLVADVLVVDIEHAQVIEAALDGRDQWLVARDPAAARAAAEKMEDLEGRVNILCTDELDAAAPAYNWPLHAVGVRLALDLVRFEPADAAVAVHLLGRTGVVDDLAAAAELHRVGPPGWRYVTRVGEVLEADGTLKAGPLNAAMGLISRRAELQALALQIAQVDARIAEYARQVSQGNAQAKALEQAQNELRNAVYQANRTQVELSGQAARTDDQQSALRREQSVLDREMENFAVQVAGLDQEEHKLAEEKQVLELEQTQRESAVEQLTASSRTLEQDVRRWAEELTAARVESGQVQEKQIAAREQVQRLAALAAELAEQAQRVGRAAEALEAKETAVQQDMAVAKQDQELQERSAAGLDKELAAAQAKVTGLNETVQGLTGRVEALRAEHGQVDQDLRQIHLGISEVRVRLETLVQRTGEELSLDLPARYAEASAGAGYQPGETDWNAVAEEIRVLREKIQRLGNVNIDAIGEQDELEKRQVFLSGQVADLATAKQQLQELIQTINNESSIRFEETFNAVREHFQGMFRKLFGGGKADIYLETELPAVLPAAVSADGEAPPPEPVKIDVLDAGIEIVARPPGKQPVTISQLSGGEKTMACVALLLSIFKSKPSPFCILDEVDAALDEANNQRFNMVVQEFLDQSQFIVITHSKRTMQIADVLYGVTMQEQGVSKRVAVRFDEVDAQGRISEQAAA